MSKTYPRRLPAGAMIVPVERIVRDELTLPSLDGDGLLVRAPRWEVMLADRWVRAATFVQSSAASLDRAPSALLVVARPMPESSCLGVERPADPQTEENPR